MTARKRAAPDVRGVVRQLDGRIKELERELKRVEPLREEHLRLLAARAAMLREPPPGRVSGARRLSRDDIAGYLEEHGPIKAADLAEALGVPLTNVSAHLYRGKNTDFENTREGWRLVDRKEPKR